MSADLPRIATRGPSEDSTIGPARVFIKEGTDGKAKTVIIIGDEAEGESSVSSVFTMCNSAIGAGVLSLPFAFGCAGDAPMPPKHSHRI